MATKLLSFNEIRKLPGNYELWESGGYGIQLFHVNHMKKVLWIGYDNDVGACKRKAWASDTPQFFRSTKKIEVR